MTNANTSDMTAATTQLSRALMDVTIDGEEAKLLRDYLVQEDDDEPTPIRLLLGDGHSGHGLYLAAAEYPEEGAIFLAEVSPPVRVTGASTKRRPQDDEAFDCEDQD